MLIVIDADGNRISALDKRCRSSEKLSIYPKFQGDIDACDSIVEKIEKKGSH